MGPAKTPEFYIAEDEKCVASLVGELGERRPVDMSNYAPPEDVVILLPRVFDFEEDYENAAKVIAVFRRALVCRRRIAYIDFSKMQSISPACIAVFCCYADLWKRRFPNVHPKARNAKLAELMRRMHFCEASGSGWDKIVSSCEAEHLPVPHIDKYDSSVKVTLFAEQPYAKISRNEKILAIYYHACVQHMISERLTNSSLRKRFGLKDSDSANLSRLVKDAVAAGYIKPHDPSAGWKFMSYVPFWA